MTTTPLWPPPFFAKSRYSLLFPPAAVMLSVPLCASRVTAKSTKQKNNNTIFQLLSDIQKFSMGTTVWQQHVKRTYRNMTIKTTDWLNWAMQVHVLCNNQLWPIPFLCCVALTSTPLWPYHCPSVLSYLTGSGVGVWGSTVNRSIIQSCIITSVTWIQQAPKQLSETTKVVLEKLMYFQCRRFSTTRGQNCWAIKLCKRTLTITTFTMHTGIMCQYWSCWPNNSQRTFVSSTFLCNLKILCFCFNFHWAVQIFWTRATCNCYHFWRKIHK